METHTSPQSQDKQAEEQEDVELIFSCAIEPNWPDLAAAAAADLYSNPTENTEISPEKFNEFVAENPPDTSQNIIPTTTNHVLTLEMENHQQTAEDVIVSDKELEKRPDNDGDDRDSNKYRVKRIVYEDEESGIKMTLKKVPNGPQETEQCQEEVPALQGNHNSPSSHSSSSSSQRKREKSNEDDVSEENEKEIQEKKTKIVPPNDPPSPPGPPNPPRKYFLRKYDRDRYF